MSEDAKYAELLKEIGSILYEKNRSIGWLEYKLSEMQKRLNEAEAQIKKETEG